jgi:hypothetical protein
MSADYLFSEAMGIASPGSEISMEDLASFVQQARHIQVRFSSVKANFSYFILMY